MPRKRRAAVEENQHEVAQNTLLENRPSGPSNLLVVLLIVVSFFAGYLFFKVKNLEQGRGVTQTTQAQPTNPTTVPLNKIKPLFSNGYLHFGDANRKALFVEVSDPSCPYCHAAGGKNPELSKQISPQFQYVADGGTYVPPVAEMRKLVDAGKASYVMLFGNGHGNGLLGMQSLYCAYDKNKFWDVHDLLMSNAGYDLLNNKVKNDKQNIPQLTDFLAGAVDKDYLTSCLQSGKYEKTLQRDQQADQTLYFQGTPHFLVNTKIFGGAQSFKTMEADVNAALGK